MLFVNRGKREGGVGVIREMKGGGGFGKVGMDYSRLDEGDCFAC